MFIVVNNKMEYRMAKVRVWCMEQTFNSVFSLCILILRFFLKSDVESLKKRNTHADGMHCFLETQIIVLWQNTYRFSMVNKLKKAITVELKPHLILL